MEKKLITLSICKQGIMMAEDMGVFDGSSRLGRCIQTQALKIERLGAMRGRGESQAPIQTRHRVF